MALLPVSPCGAAPDTHRALSMVLAPSQETIGAGETCGGHLDNQEWPSRGDPAAV